jgi:hypothetical protein
MFCFADLGSYSIVALAHELLGKIEAVTISNALAVVCFNQGHTSMVAPRLVFVFFPAASPQHPSDETVVPQTSTKTEFAYIQAIIPFRPGILHAFCVIRTPFLPTGLGLGGGLDWIHTCDDIWIIHIDVVVIRYIELSAELILSHIINIALLQT